MEITKVSKKSALVIGIMVIAILLCFSNPAQGAQEGDYTYIVTDGEAEVTRYNGSGGGVTIPSTLGGVPVTSIGDDAFSYCSGLTSIELPASVTSIGGNAFSNCTSLTSINIPEGVTILPHNIFSDCESLTSIDIPESVTSIGDNAFRNCSGLTNIKLPDSVTSIGYYAFSACESLTNITFSENLTTIDTGALYGCKGLGSVRIPESVINIGDNAFGSCTNLTNITTDVGNLNYASIDGILYDKTGTTLVTCPGGLASFDIPEHVTSIGDYAFSGCERLTNITISENITSIGRGAFFNCTGLTSIVIPKAITSIELTSFSGCTGLTSVDIPESVTSIGNWAFSHCTALPSINIPESVTNIGPWAFQGCTSLTELTIPKKVAHITEDIFGDCKNLATLTFDSATTEIQLLMEPGAVLSPTTPKIIGHKNSSAEEYAKIRNLVFEEKPIAVTVNGTPVEFDQPPVILEGRTMVPMRAIFEALDAQVNWDAQKQSVAATKKGVTIIVQIGNQQATVNGVAKTLDVPAQIMKSRTMVPVRFISESLGAQVDWEANTQAVRIKQ